MQFDIRNRWTGAVQFSCELTAEVAGQSCSTHLGFAVKKAVQARANLTGANLTGVSWFNTTCPDGTNSNSNGGGGVPSTCIGHLFP